VEQQKHELLTGQRQLREAQRAFDLAVQAAQRGSSGNSTAVQMPDNLPMRGGTSEDQSPPPPLQQGWPTAMHSPPSPPAPMRHSTGSSRQYPMHVSTGNSSGHSWGPEITMSRNNWSPQNSGSAQAALQPLSLIRGDNIPTKSGWGAHKPQAARQSQVVAEQQLFLQDIGAI